MKILGIACVCGFLSFALSLSAQTFTTLHSFEFTATDGAYPYAALVQATNGNLYGTTHSGGASSDGTVFKITPGGTMTTLLSYDYTDGQSPQAALVQATNGNFHGTTYYGGANGTCIGASGCGTVFKITPNGTLTTLYSFCSQSSCTDGQFPYAGLVLSTNGNLYGTTYEGGDGANGTCSGGTGCGTVFKITPSGTLTRLYSFCSQSGCTDGELPSAGLVQAINGNFYGTTSYGGAHGVGTVFKITPSGTLTTLYSFCSQSGCTDGELPSAGLIQATNGNLYGTTEAGGAHGVGTVFKITPNGTLTTLYSFCPLSGCADGAYPIAGLVQATDGNFYGTTDAGGPGDIGTIFKITPGGTLTTLHSFDGTDGSQPLAGLVQDTNGNFYGTTELGGAVGFGTVFSLSVGLGPFVETLPTSGKVGATVKILGTNLTGATSVTFDGTAATFTVVSKSEITTTVPTGATTGTVEVTIPSGTLKSNTKFRVTP